MLGRGVTVSDAAHRWVNEFSRFPHGMISKLASIDIDSWREVTMPSTGDRVYVFGQPEGKADGAPYEGTESFGKISGRVDEDAYMVMLDDGETVIVSDGGFDLDRDSYLPMWGTMWQFGDGADDYWLEELGGIQAMSDCGFRIYENDEWGYFFGIDGAGYDFFEAHWIPLYRKRGLRWHDPETESGENGIKEAC